MVIRVTPLSHPFIHERIMNIVIPFPRSRSVITTMNTNIVNTIHIFDNVIIGKT
jgi:hypothetical protein